MAILDSLKKTNTLRHSSAIIAELRRQQHLFLSFADDRMIAQVYENLYKLNSMVEVSHNLVLHQ